jgi:hypothetical protein
VETRNELKNDRELRTANGIENNRMEQVFFNEESLYSKKDEQSEDFTGLFLV